MDGFKFEFDDIISLYKNSDSERRRSVSLGYFYTILIILLLFQKKNVAIAIWLNSKLIKSDSLCTRLSQ